MSVDDTTQVLLVGSHLALTMNMPRYNNTQWPRQRTPIGPTTESFRSHKAILERNKLNDSWSTRGSHVLINREVVAHKIDMLPAHFTWSQNQKDLLYLRFAPN